MTSIEEALRSGAVPTCKQSLQVAIKPLEWRGSSSGSPVGEYVARKDFLAGDDAPWDLSLDGMGIGGVYASLREAKAAAQADYEARILSALSPDPALVALIEERDRLKVERDEAVTAFATGAYDDACRRETGIHQHALAFTVEQLRKAEARALAAEAECDALREALRDLADRAHQFGTFKIDEEDGDPVAAWDASVVPALNAARRALTQETNDGE